MMRFGENRPKNIKVSWNHDIRVGYDENWWQDMIFTRKNDILGPQITRKGPKYTILMVGFFNVSSMSHIWRTRPGPEEKIFGLHYFRVENEKVWSNSMISDVPMGVDKWYGSLVFDPILIDFSMSILRMMLWSQIWWLSQGSPRKIFDLHDVVIGDNKGLITWGRWDVQSGFKEEWIFFVLFKKKFSPLLVSCQALGGLPRHEEGGELFENSCFWHVLRHIIIFYTIFPAS